MKPSLPYVPWYHGDFLRSTVGWTLLEQAVYWKLLCAQWDIGPLPDDLTRLAAIVGIDMAGFSGVWGLVGKKFKSTPTGLVNERCEWHRNKYVDFRARQSEGGRKAMAKRWGDRKNTKVVPIRPEGETP